MEKTPFGAKPIEQHRQHFIDRVWERYEVDMTVEDYDRIVNEKSYVGLSRKSSLSTIVYLDYKGVRIVALLNKARGILTTAYPPDSLTDVMELLRCMFSTRYWPIARTIYNDVMKQLEPYLNKEYGTQREAWEAIKETNFRSVLMLHYKNGGRLPVFDLACEIRDIILQDHERLTVEVVKKKKGS